MKLVLMWIGGIIAGLIVVQITLGLISLVSVGLWSGVQSLLSFGQSKKRQRQSVRVAA